MTLKPVCILVVLWCLCPMPAAAQQAAPQAPAATPALDIIYVPTPREVVDEMLKLAHVTGQDVIYDLGSGDGRIPITAAQEYGARGVGIDLDPARVAEANANAVAAGVTDKVRFLQQDLFTTDISAATVVTLYLLPELNLRLVPKLNRELRPGTRIVSHSFDIKGFPPQETRTVNGRIIYLWTTPLHP